MEEREKNRVEEGTLYLVGTPIGNLADLSERAKKVLSEVDFVAAEDTRGSFRLLSCFGIHTELVSYFEHNKKASGERILERLERGESCALVTDAGMPAISDPGEDIVRLCAEKGIPVRVVPGPCAAVSALALSGLPTGKFVFEGFLSAVRGERVKRLGLLATEERTVIVYEAPHKLRRTLADLSEIFGKSRKIAICRELTKINEEILRFSMEEAVAYYQEHEPRGEYVLVVEGARAGAGCDEPPETILSPPEQVAALEAEGMSRSDALKAAARAYGMKKSDFYRLLEEEKDKVRKDVEPE